MAKVARDLHQKNDEDTRSVSPETNELDDKPENYGIAFPVPGSLRFIKMKE